MKKQLFTPQQLEALGFIFLYEHPLDDGGHYEVYELEKGDSKLSIIYEWNEDGSFLTDYVEFNDTILKGRDLTASDVELLKQIM